MSLRDIKTIKERRSFIEEKAGIALSAISQYPKSLETAQFTNCENMIGAVSLPLGIAGPLRIRGNNTQGDYYIPLATTEGALVASVNRGCKAITLSTGAYSRVNYVGMTRGSVFKTKSLKESFTLKNWFLGNKKLLKEVSEATSKHLKFKDLFIKLIGRNVFVRMIFDTADAMGMNMVTFAADRIARLTEEKTGCTCVSLAGNFDIDKKPAWLNFILGRGFEVWAETVLESEIIKSVLKTTPERIDQVAKEKCLLGSAVSGSLGFNGHFANIIAAVFAATGQDIAHTVEGSLGITTTEVDKKGLYISVYLPDLVIGTVGGGTKLPAQKECLEILGIGVKSDEGDVAKFAEIIAGAVLAGEISLLASLSSGSLALAHKKLARRT